MDHFVSRMTTMAYLQPGVLDLAGDFAGRG